MPEVVFDACVLSNFALSDSFHIIRTLYKGAAFMTPFVNAEITKGIQARHELLREVKSAVKLGLIKEISLAGAEENSLFESLSRCLGSGEASSIAVAKRRGLTFASDDKVARREAARLGVKLTGTLRILKKAVLMKILTAKEADGILEKMTASGFYTPFKSIREVL